LGELAEIIDDVNVKTIPISYAIVEAVEPFKLHPISMSYIYYVFEHLKQLWMGIWQNIHTATTLDVSPDLGELAEIIDDVSVKTNLIRYQ
jgi:hypothetical protein